MTLNEKQFGTLYHGTGHPLVGDKIVPGHTIGHSQWKDAGSDIGERSDLQAWATPDERLAWGYAINASVRLDKTDAATRARVHEVHPHSGMTKGNTHTLEDTGFDEYHAFHFDTTGKVHDIMPGRQGTFPTINWRQFTSKPNRDFDDDPNEAYDANHPHHPTPVEAEQQDIPNMHPKSHPTLPLGDIEVKQWDGRVARQTVDAAVRDRTAHTDRPYNVVTPIGHMPEHRQKYPNVVTK